MTILDGLVADAKFFYSVFGNLQSLRELVEEEKGEDMELQLQAIDIVEAEVAGL